MTATRPETRQPGRLVSPRVLLGVCAVAVLLMVLCGGIVMHIHPGWDTPERAYRIFETLLFVAAVATALCAVATAVSMWGYVEYGRRREQLQVEQAQQREERQHLELERQAAATRAAEEAAARARAEATKLAGRTISDSQAEVLRRVLSSAPHASVTIISSDTESFNYAEQLSDTLKAAGWSAKHHSGVGTFDFNPSRGNVLQFGGAANAKESMEANDIKDLRPQSLVPKAGTVLAQALREAGIDTKFATMYGVDRGAMYFIIGYR